MGLFKKKKKKEKKPITIDRVLKFLTPIFVFVIIIVAGVGTVKSCGIVDTYESLKNELEQPFNVEDILTNNKIISADEYNLKQKLGPNGADLEIFINNEISKEVFKNTNAFNVVKGIELTEAEIGAFTNLVNSTTELGVKFKILELNIEKVAENNFKFDSVSQIDITNIDLGIEIDTSKIKTFYVMTSASLKIENSYLQIVEATSRINNLTQENNDLMLGVLNILIGYRYDFCFEMAVETINDYAIKTASVLAIENGKVCYEI